mmetsp:Transcript_52970/g.158562  ORF Transcript_52970/g.158562 Transcript_52970/m.158562 type:complete len:214 (-) Transcript_52970:853-1494(-)
MDVHSRDSIAIAGVFLEEHPTVAISFFVPRDVNTHPVYYVVLSELCIAALPRAVHQGVAELGRVGVTRRDSAAVPPSAYGAVVPAVRRVVVGYPIHVAEHLVPRNRHFDLSCFSIHRERLREHNGGWGAGGPPGVVTYDRVGDTDVISVVHLHPAPRTVVHHHITQSDMMALPYRHPPAHVPDQRLRMHQTGVPVGHCLSICDFRAGALNFQA